MGIDYMTAEDVGDWARHQPADGFYCKHCLTRLAETDDGQYYCPNGMCLYEEQGTIEEE